MFGGACQSMCRQNTEYLFTYLGPIVYSDCRFYVLTPNSSILYLQMETVKPQYKWTKSTQKSLSTSQTRPGQAIALDLVQKKIGPRYNHQIDSQFYVCKKIFCGTDNRVRNAEREYKILQKLSHRHILTYADFSYNSDFYIAFLYIKYCDQGDLDLFLPGKPQVGQFIENYASDVARQISSALVYLHHGVIAFVDKNGGYSDLKLAEKLSDSIAEGKHQVYLHRDIKPGNNKFCRKMFF